MAKLGSCRPLLQGGMMMLLAILLLASIQAGPVMAAPEQIVVDAFGHVRQAGTKVIEGLRETLGGNAPGKIADTGANMALTGADKKGWVKFVKGAKLGLKIHKKFCKAQGWMENQNPGGGTGTPYPYLHCWSQPQPQPQPQPQVAAAGAMPLSTVQIMGISVVGRGQEAIPLVQPSYLDSSLYGRLMQAVMRQTKALNPWVTPTASPPTADKLCYAAASPSVPLWLPEVAILVADDNNAVQTLELEGSATDSNVWYQESFTNYCLGIWRTTDGMITLGRP